MRFGVSLPSMSSNPHPERLIMVVQEAETHGFDSVWVPDHVLRVFGPILDPFTILSFVAGVTQHVGLGTNVLVLPYRHPLILANEAASLDVLSGGRFVLGAGVGWNEEEFSALGITAREQGRRTNEALEAIRQLWVGGPANIKAATTPSRAQHSGRPPKQRAGRQSWLAATVTPLCGGTWEMTD